MPRPVRIVRIIARLNTGGPAMHTILLTRALHGERFTSRLVTGVVGPGEGDMQYYAEQQRVVPLVIPELGRAVSPLDDLRALVKLFKVLRGEQPDVVHTHTAKAGLLGRLATVAYNLLAVLAGVPRARIVHTFHGHIFHAYFGPLVSCLLVLAERILAVFTDRVIAVSERIRDDLVERYRICGARKVVVVALGLDFGWTKGLDEAAGWLRVAHGVPPDAVAVGIVGRLTDVKNHALLLDAVRDRPDVRVFAFGDGELRGVLEDAARRAGIDDRVIFMGWERDPARIYVDIDLVCLTSKNEGTPVALLEAMAAGRPFVATRVGGVPDLMVGEPVEHPAGFTVYANGILIPPGDARALAAALAYMVDRPGLRQAMGLVGQAAVLKRFSAERLAQDVEAIYLQLLGSSASDAQ
jgi:glycosyltransferase involved in cell wall biosynthesis